MGKNSAYRKKTYKELTDILSNENCARNGILDIEKNITSLVTFINTKLNKAQNSSLSLAEQAAFSQSTASKIKARGSKLDVLAFGRQLYISSHRSWKKFIGLLRLKGIYIEVNDHEQYQEENENLSALIDFKDCLTNELDQIIAYVIRRGDIHHQYNLDLQNSSVAIRAAAKMRSEKLDSLEIPSSVYVPLVKTILDAGLSNDVESHVYDAQDPKTAPQDSDSPQKLGDEEPQTAQTLRKAGEAQEDGDFPAKDFKEQVGEHYPESVESCKLSEEFLASAESHVLDSQDRKTALQHGDSGSRNVGDTDQQTAQTLHNAGEAQEKGDILAKEIKEHVGEHYPESGESCKLSEESEDKSQTVDVDNSDKDDKKCWGTI